MKHKIQKGFTLIELLVVIAIIAILAVVVVLTLNPAQLLAQARDSNRISDFATLKSALALYGTDVATATPMNGGAGTFGLGAYALYTATGASTTTSSYETIATWGFLGSETSVTTTALRSVNGLGWIPVNLSAISSGAPISVLPVDPVNSAPNFYVYAASTTYFKLATKMESTKYQLNGASDVVSADGGNSSTTYEQGSNLTTL
jgi:prepilin-type N-terminal cleavage/methylation domain-containing protein